jgi:glycerol-3-phosphate dehydrogenase
VTRQLTGDLGLAVTSRHRDPDAVLSRGGRHYFIAPWRGHALIGNTDTPYRDEPDGFRIEPAEIAEFLAEINRAYPAAALSEGDVLHAFGGIQLADAKRLGKGAQIAKHPVFVDHRRDLNLAGLLTVIGVKYTACRWVAEKTADRVCRALGYRRAPCLTARTPLLGGDLRNVEEFLRRTREAAPPDLPDPLVERLGLLYGTQVPRLLRLMRQEPDLARPVPGTRDGTPMAAVAYAVRHEGAVRLDDVIMRRTELGTLGHPGDATIHACADWMANALNWDATRRQNEIDRMAPYWPASSAVR